MEDIPVIAKDYGLTESNVRMMLSRTRQKLKKYLQQEGYM
jgi:DNA-directed RNA polymerase specialized sigma24 family protein